MRQLGVPPKTSDIVRELPPINNWLEIAGELLRQYQQGPAFSAYQSVAHTIGNGVFTAVRFNVEEWDVTGAYDTSTWRFTPQLAGYYQINAAVQWLFSVSGHTVLSIFKNGVEHKRGLGPTGGTFSITVSGVVYLNGSTDYVDIRAYQASGGNMDTQPVNYCTNFQGYLVRPA